MGYLYPSRSLHFMNIRLRIFWAECCIWAGEGFQILDPSCFPSFNKHWALNIVEMQKTTARQSVRLLIGGLKAHSVWSRIEKRIEKPRATNHRTA